MKFNDLQDLVARTQRAGIDCLVKFIRGNELASVTGGLSIDHDRMMLVVDVFISWHRIPVSDVREVHPRPYEGRR